ncbi:hypothetical protein PENSPDRAFT_114488 [Peniophora sp. CONT]|nr:hypothetical protein PENSPDRAFT_114488 [Peniophora sp. CONT]
MYRWRIASRLELRVPSLGFFQLATQMAPSRCRCRDGHIATIREGVSFDYFLRQLLTSRSDMMHDALSRVWCTSRGTTLTITLHGFCMPVDDFCFMVIGCTGGDGEDLNNASVRLPLRGSSDDVTTQRRRRDLVFNLRPEPLNS